jgi:5-methyltetrahydropteroyltriglutamate--homocysteine methyltransferase
VKRSTDKIVVSHVGSLPAPEKLSEIPGGAGQPDAGASAARAALASAVADIVRAQEETGIDIVNDGELAKTGGFSRYAAERMNGIEQVDVASDDLRWSADLRDRREFPGFYSNDSTGFAKSGRRRRRWACTAPT